MLYYSLSFHLCLDVLGPVGVHERVARLLELVAGWADVRDHDGAAVPAQRFFQQPR